MYLLIWKYEFIFFTQVYGTFKPISDVYLRNWLKDLDPSLVMTGIIICAGLPSKKLQGWELEKQTGRQHLTW